MRADDAGGEGTKLLFALSPHHLYISGTKLFDCRKR